MGGGASKNTVQKSEVTQSNLPEYARPYFEGMMTRANADLNRPYIPYGYTQDKVTGKVVQARDAQGNVIDPQRIAGFTKEQTDLQNNIMNYQAPGEFGQASGIVSDAAQRSITAGQYNPGQFTSQQINAPNNVQAQQVSSRDMQAAQSGYNPNLNYFQMQGPDSFAQSGMAQQYMSPYMQAALEPQRREALRAAQQGQLVQGLGSARQGAYGGSRQLLAGMERERNLGQNLADIQARGMQTAFEQAQGQFNTEQQARQAAGRTNLEAALGVQSLGAGQNLQVALANLSNEQQARVSNQAQQFQAQGMNAENALRASLANQQTGLSALQSNQQADLDRQRMMEQSRQFGSSQGLAGLAQAGQMGQTLSNIGSARSQADQARFGLQTSTAAQRQALNQQRLDQYYQDFLRQRDYPMEQLQQYSSLLRGVPVTPTTTATTYAPNASIGSQLLGGGLAAAGIYNTFKGG
jgi:hypothetical protein